MNKDNKYKKLHELVKVQYCIDSVADSVTVLQERCQDLKAMLRDVLPHESQHTPIYLIKIEKVSRILDVSRPMVYKLIEQGNLEAVRIGTRGIRITISSLNCFVSQNKISSYDIGLRLVENDELKEAGE